MDKIKKVKSYGRNYKVYNGIYYSADTSNDMIYLLDKLKSQEKRVQFRWGEPKTGKDWGDEYDIEGKIGLSTGPVKIPLLIKTKRSYGGGGILTSNIVKIMESKGKKVIYQHKKYHLDKKIKQMLKTNKSMKKAYKRLGVI